jgi:aminoglycoside 3-N-acetyltransferase I
VLHVGAAYNRRMACAIRHLTGEDVPLLRRLNAMFGEAFGEPDTYTGNPPSDAYLRGLLEDRTFTALAAIEDDVVVGGLAAYEFRKFEQERSEVYLYDLAVAASHRRRGIATALVERLREIAAARGAYVIFVQADTNAEDAPAIELYTKLGKREEVLHFDIDV